MPRDETAAPPAGRSLRTAVRATVLVVDDDPVSTEIITTCLTETRYAIRTASNGAEAWHMLALDPAGFDVVLADRIMPEMNGIELLGRIKRDPEMGTLPVIMVTSAARREDILEGIRAGAYYYLSKPVDCEILLSMVTAAVAESDRYKALQREARSDAGVLAMMSHGTFEYRTTGEAAALGAFLAKACPDPERVLVGLIELLVNAVEHGNLEISYEEKTALQRDGRLEAEIERRLLAPEYHDRHATVSLERNLTSISIRITDQGRGFDPTPYLEIDPARVFDSHGRGIAIANLIAFDHLEYRLGGRQAVGTLRV